MRRIRMGLLSLTLITVPMAGYREFTQWIAPDHGTVLADSAIATAYSTVPLNASRPVAGVALDRNPL